MSFKTNLVNRSLLRSSRSKKLAEQNGEPELACLSVFKVVSFDYDFRFANVHSVGLPTRLPWSFGDGVDLMTEIVEELLVIDSGLRFALFGLECSLGVPFNGAECERVFHDAVADQRSAKQYV